MRILITGSNGLLGQKIVAHCLKNKITFLATSKGLNRNVDCPKSNYLSLDISNHVEVLKVFSDFSPTHVIHTAAITNVDYCVLNPEDCIAINTLSVQELFAAAKKVNAHFQLLSTDFVFDGLKGKGEQMIDHVLASYSDAEIYKKTQGFKLLVQKLK